MGYIERLDILRYGGFQSPLKISDFNSAILLGAFEVEKGIGQREKMTFFVLVTLKTVHKCSVRSTNGALSFNFSVHFISFYFYDDTYYFCFLSLMARTLLTLFLSAIENEIFPF